MRATEITTVFDAISGYDGRTWATGSAQAWFAIVGRYPLADVMQAVTEHYATNEKRIMPVNIRTRCIQLGDIRANAERRALEAPTAPVVTEVGRQAQEAIRAIVGRVSERTRHAYLEGEVVDPYSPTSATSDVTEAARREQMARLRAMAISA